MVWNRTSREFFHLDLTANYKRRSLVDTVRLYIEDAPLPIGRDAAGLFRNKRDRIGFIQQPQFALWMTYRRRIEEHAACK